MTEFGQHPRGLVDRGCHFRMHLGRGGPTGPVHHTDAQRSVGRPEVGIGIGEVRHLERVTGSRPADQIQVEGGVAHRTTDDEVDRQPEKTLAVVGRRSHPAPGDLQSDEAAARSRDADGPPAVGTVGGRDDARSYCSRGAAAGAPGGAIERPRVASGAVDQGLGGAADAVLGGVGPPQEPDAGGLPALDEEGVGLGHVTLCLAAAHLHPPPGATGGQVLEQERDSGQGALGDCRAGVGEPLDEGVDPRVGALHGFTGQRGQLVGGDLPGADQGRQGRGVQGGVVG